MKKILSIPLVIVFCIYAFNFKTHYCYHADSHNDSHEWHDHYGKLQICEEHEANERYHGDCNGSIREIMYIGGLTDQNLFPVLYYCTDILKSTCVLEAKSPPGPHSISDIVVFPLEVNISIEDHDLPSFFCHQIHCRGGPSQRSNSLRAPPLV